MHGVCAGLSSLQQGGVVEELATLAPAVRRLDVGRNSLTTLECVKGLEQLTSIDASDNAM